MASIIDMSFEQGFRQFACPPCVNMIGKTYHIRHLASERGQALNGKKCQVVDFKADYRKNPEARLACVVSQDGDAPSAKPKPIAIKGANLVR
ncbi:hypothetical protein ACHAWF_012917 [Thalassiosira exigua]